MKLLTLSWKNIIYKPGSMILTLTLFALGVGLISFLFVANQQLEDKFENNLAGIDLVIGAKGSPLQLILCNMYHIDAPTGNISISESKAFLNPNHPLIDVAVPLSLGDSYRGYRIVGTTHTFLELYNGQIAEGSKWQNDFEVTIGYEVARILGLKIGDEFFSSHGFVQDDNLEHSDSHTLQVVGILQRTGSVLDQLILTNTQTIWGVHDHEEAAPTEEETHDHDHDHANHDHEGEKLHDHTSISGLLEHPEEDITSILIRFKSRNYQTLNMQRSINENTEMQAATPAIEVNRLFSLMGVGFDVLRVLGWIIAIVSGLSIFISLYNSLKERKYELALMRVMGSSPWNLSIMIILEGVILSLLGFVIGLAISHIGMFLLSDYMLENYRYSFEPWKFVKEEGFLFIGSIVIGIIAAIIPAMHAYRTQISETLADH